MNVYSYQYQCNLFSILGVIFLNCKKEQRHFLKLKRYTDRDYIPQMAELATPLNKLTKEGALCFWGNVYEKAFELLRGKLIKEPVVLAFPEWKTLFT